MKTWRDISANPNSIEAILWRRMQLQTALVPLVEDRIEYLRSLARGRRVLDVGVVDHGTSTTHRPTWLHASIASEASHCLGVDILPDDVEELERAGYNVRCCDITREALDEEFDLILCGEIIEHLGRPEELIAGARRALAPGGRIVITSPNPSYIGLVLLHWTGRSMDNVDHVTLFSPSGLTELAERQGLRLASYRGVMLGTASWRERLLFKLRRVLRLSGIRDEAFCTTLLYEFVEADRP